MPKLEPTADERGYRGNRYRFVCWLIGHRWYDPFFPLTNGKTLWATCARCERWRAVARYIFSVN